MVFNSPQIPILAVIAKDIPSKVYYFGSGVTQARRRVRSCACCLCLICKFVPFLSSVLLRACCLGTQGRLWNLLMLKAEFCYAPPGISPLYVSKTASYSTGMQPGTAAWNFFKTVSLAPPFSNNVASMFRGDSAVRLLLLHARRRAVPFCPFFACVLSAHSTLQTCSLAGCHLDTERAEDRY